MISLVIQINQCKNGAENQKQKGSDVLVRIFSGISHKTKLANYHVNNVTLLHNYVIPEVFSDYIFMIIFKSLK